MINRQALVGLIGANIMKSLSPAMQIDAFAAAGIAGHYHLMDVEQLPGRTLESLLQAAKTAGFIGVNVTYPFKQAIIPLLDEVSPEARQIGAVNIVTISRDGRTMGNNTDRSGFRRNFEAALGRGAAAGKTAVLIGAGGAGSAVAFALMDLGIETLFVHDSDRARAKALTGALRVHFGAARCRLSENLDAEIAAADGVCNATPVGMTGIPGNPVPMDNVSSRHWVADVIYSPIETELIKAAAARGARTLTGGGMSVFQAVDSFRIFTGIDPDPVRMAATFARALAERGL